MRLRALLTGDIRFQFKYGFYFVYLIFTVLYISVLFMLPASWREKAAVLMVFSDPAAMGLYFMGSIILFEKSEHVLDSIAVSPVLPHEYVASKLLSISMIATPVAFLIGMAGGAVPDPFSFFIGVFLGSALFSAIGLMVAANILSLNRFILATIPAELLINIPAIAYLFGWDSPWLLLHPGVCIIVLCLGGAYSLPAAFILAAWTALFSLLACRIMTGSFQTLGGVKL